MPSARDVLAPSGRLLRSVVVASALACSTAAVVLLPAAVAAADEPAGTTVVGELVQVWAEGQHADDDHAAEDHAAEEPLTFVEPVAGEAVRVPTDEVQDLPAGATVSVTVGAQVEDEASTEDGVEPAHTVLTSDVLATDSEAASPAAAGPGHEVTVVLVAPAGATQDGTELEDVVEAVNGPVAEFWEEQSGGAITLGVTGEHDWTTTAAGCSTPTKLWNEAAAAVEFVPGKRKHLLLYVTENAPDCAYALAEVGRDVEAGGRLYVRDTVPSIIAHELGHNFGLAHSSGRQCDGTVETGSCRTSSYRDYYDVMGVSWEQLGSLNAPQAARLGLLPADATTRMTVQDRGRAVTLAPLGTGGVQVLRLTDADGVDYWLEYRAATGRDDWLGDDRNRYGLQEGVVLRRTGNFPDSSLLLDGTPSAKAGWNRDLQAALPIDAPVPVSGGDFRVTVTGISPAGAELRIVPSPPAEGDRPAPAPVEVPADTVLEAAGAGVAGEAAGTTGHAGAVSSPATAGTSLLSHSDVSAQTVRDTPDLQQVAGVGVSEGYVVPAAGAVLAGITFLFVRRLRKPTGR